MKKSEEGSGLGQVMQVCEVGAGLQEPGATMNGRTGLPRV